MCKGNGGGGGSSNCSLRDLSKIFAIWTIVVGAGAILVCILQLTVKLNSEYKYIQHFTFVYLGFAVLHLISGLILMYAVIKKKACLFLLGIILSSIYPYILFFCIVPLGLQIFFTVVGCRYYREELRGN